MGSIARKSRRLQEQEDEREERLQILREKAADPVAPHDWRNGSRMIFSTEADDPDAP